MAEDDLRAVALALRGDPALTQLPPEDAAVTWLRRGVLTGDRAAPAGMLVEVVELRRRGTRLPDAAVRDIAPLRGLLSLDTGRAGWFPGQRQPLLLASLLHPEKPEAVLPPLDRARVVKIVRGRMLVVGWQFLTDRRDRAEYKQAWVAWPVGG